MRTRFCKPPLVDQPLHISLLVFGQRDARGVHAVVLGSLSLNYFLMNILCIGGGPAGLYFALLMKQRNPGHRVVVVERNRPFDTFGWGVVLSDQTLGNLRAADPVGPPDPTRSTTGTTSRCSSRAARCAPPATAFAASAASACSTSCRTAA
jgi:hypothetical protein